MLPVHRLKPRLPEADLTISTLNPKPETFRIFISGFSKLMFRSVFRPGGWGRQISPCALTLRLAGFDEPASLIRLPFFAFGGGDALAAPAVAVAVVAAGALLLLFLLLMPHDGAPSWPLPPDKYKASFAVVRS